MAGTLLLAALPCACAQAVPSFDAIRYTLDLTPDIPAKSVAGVESIELRSLETGLKQLRFSPNALVIDSASVNGKPVSVSSTKEFTGFDLVSPLASGQSATLRIVFHGVPASGVVFTADTVYTSYDACAWMICRENTPGDKAFFALDLHLAPGMQSLAVGRLTSTSKAAAGTVAHWRTEIPYSAYLYDFAAGKLTIASVKEGRDTLTYAGTDAPQPELLTAFAETPAMVRFLSDKAGVPLPGHAYAQLLVPGKEAQETATYSILGKDYLDPANDWAMIHELAHQWWGNLITCATWQDFWLNEGITVFMTAAWKEQRYGRPAYDAELANARKGVERLKAKGLDTTPLAYGGEYPNIGVRRAIQYGKGALFMDYLRTRLGEDVFWAGLKSYTQQHAGGTVTSIDFERSMEKSSGKDLSGEFAEWVFGPAASVTAK